MAEICLRHGVIICSDEIHCDLVYPGYRHVPIASLHPDIANNTITLISPSKTFNLAGLQFSVVVIQNPNLRQQYQAANKGLVSWMNLMGLTAAQAAYEHGEEWLNQLLQYLDENRRLVYEYVNQELPGVRAALPEGTFLAWLDCREAGLPVSPQRFFLEEARVALSAGESFGAGGEGFVRLNFGVRRTVLQEALSRMKAALLSRQNHGRS